MKKIFFGAVLYIITAPFCLAQVNWKNVDSHYGSLPSSVHVFTTTDTIDGKANIACYVIADLKDRKLNFTTDTTYKRRFTPQQFYEKNQQPLLVVNGTFFDFATNRNLNAVIKDGKLVSYNVHTTALKGKDTLMYLHTFRSAIGINKKRKADVAWLYTDSSARFAKAFTDKPIFIKDSLTSVNSQAVLKDAKKWKMQTAIAGGPVLVQNGEVKVTNNEERMFTGKAIEDKHPRTAMGYTADGKLIILVVQGRMPGIAEGASLTQLAKLLLDLGCVEALNLDGGGSSCMLVNGKETIKPSDKEGQRAVPGVFIIQTKNK
jgi:exopolysaccharide biosynthesis protein